MRSSLDRGIRPGFVKNCGLGAAPGRNKTGGKVVNGVVGLEIVGFGTVGRGRGCGFLCGILVKTRGSVGKRVESLGIVGVFGDGRVPFTMISSIGRGGCIVRSGVSGRALFVSVAIRPISSSFFSCDARRMSTPTCNKNVGTPKMRPANRGIKRLALPITLISSIWRVISASKSR